MYTGYTELNLTDEEYTELYSNSTLKNYLLHENEYVLIKDDNDKILDYFQYRNNRLNKLKYPVLENSYTGKYKPRNPQQYCAFDLLKDRKTTLKLVTGGFGTGKTMMMVAAALDAVEKGEFDKIIWVRNNIQVKDTDQIGALPGDSYDKLLPYLGPFVDHVGGEYGVQDLINHGQLEVIPLGFIRGRSIRNSIILSSEAENLTRQHIQLLIGRVDEGSNLWLDADLKQRDRNVFEQSKGIETLIDKLKGERLFGYVHLIKSERSETARLADKLDN